MDRSGPRRCPRAEEVHRAVHGSGAQDLRGDDLQAQRKQSDGGSRPDPAQGRCGRAGLDRPLGRGRVLVPDQDGRERAAAVRAGGLCPSAGRQAARGAAGVEAARRQAGGAD